ncbi:MAG: DUF1844 domain-containing protein [Phycisphaerales bacterium]|jgi:hypothetical protein|nr:DUF1844 domain-containing protein [Phycisphaerales bacterium]
MSEGESKIIIDSDWKSQAQAEKDKLAQKDAERQAAKAPKRDPDAPLDFQDLVGALATPAMMYLGMIPDPQSGRAVLAPDIAQQHIDLLGVLQEKTRGNLSEDEQQLMDQMVTELRYAFVETARAIEKAVREGKIKPQAMPGGGMPPSPGASGISGASGIAGPGL